nr:uncharacterized protein LOC123757229 [Procambarus clarkii]XP_045596676.1 uncharacterized protein LOC123757229 [Procambarus clarkii]XP_045596677.1 uncharacterized protein LOC123757229 [Procambarus clarkii]
MIIMAPEPLVASPNAKCFATSVFLMCFGVHAAFVVAASHQLGDTVVESSGLGTEDVRAGLWLPINSWQHFEENLKNRQLRIQIINDVALSITEKNMTVRDEKSEREKDRINKAENNKAKEEVMPFKDEAKNFTEDYVAKIQPSSTVQKIKPPQIQTSGWFFDRETVDVLTMPYFFPSEPTLRDPYILRQHLTDKNDIVMLEFQVENYHLVLDLHPTRDLLAASYRDPVLGASGESGVPLQCEFQGEVRGVADSWAALSLCHGIRGVIVGRGKELMVEPAQNTLTAKGPHRIVSINLLQHSIGACGVNSNAKKGSIIISSSDSDTEMADGVLERERREALHGDTLWTTKATRFVEMVLVADHSYYETYLNNTVPRCKAIVNIVNALFRPLGVVVVLTHLEVWDTKDQIVVDKDSNKTIDNLKPYRKKLLTTLPDVPNDTTQLLTTIDFTGITIGKATMNGMCSYEDSVGVVQDQKLDGITYVAQTLAHELGHNLGLGHDEDDKDCQCETNNCIMNTSRDRHSSRITWSSCSKRNLTRSLKAFSFDCLKNVPSKLFSGNSCGNGVVEEGEECDCGPADYCENPCCISDTCKFVTNATCATGPCCDTKTCTPKPTWTVCRDATADCDIPEYCSGTSEYCPPDIVEKDGTYCRGGKGHCYKGECGSHEGRCQQVWGASALSGSPQCYTQINQEGGPYGNCGLLDSDGSALQPCSLHDAMCGTLHCHTDADVKPKFGIVSYTAWSKDNHDCRTIFSTSDIPPSYWLSPDGASCGEGMMCVSQRCVPIPGSSLGMLFWMLLVLILVIFCFLWDPLRWWWVKKGRAWFSPTFPRCAACLDTCCCPFMSKVMQWTVTICPLRKRKKPDKKKIKGNKEANGNVASQLDQDTTQSWPVNTWGGENEQQPVEVAYWTPSNIHLTSNSSVLHHKTVELGHPVHHNSITSQPTFGSGEVPLLNNVHSATNWPIPSSDARGQITESTPTSPNPLSDDEVISKLSELTQKLNIISGTENITRQIVQPQVSSDSLSEKLVPVRKAPSPPVQKDGNKAAVTNSSRSSQSIMPSTRSPVSSQMPEPTISLRQEPVIPPRPEPVIPPRPQFNDLQDSLPQISEYNLFQKPEPTIPPRPVYNVSPRSEYIVPPRPEPSIPPRPEFSEVFVSHKQEPVAPPIP